jgi:hypothetical protein
MRKPYVPASVVPWVAVAVAAVMLDVPQVVSQIMLPLFIAFSVFAAGPGACFKRGGQP